jgi:hypothetical protein
MLLAVPASADENQMICRSVPASAAGASGRMADPLVVARIVFVSFPNEYQDLPTWGEAMRAELTDYIAAMSRGRQHFDLTILTRPDTPGRAWLAANPASYYQDPARGMAALNREIMTRIDSLMPNAWNGVEQVFMVHYQCAWTPSECVAVGWSSLGFAGPGYVPGFSGLGTTQRIIGTDVNGDVEAESARHIAAHEYGHTLGFIHSPGTDPAITFPAELVNMGYYDAMTATASFIRQRGIFPYHAMWLSDAAGVAWVPREIITADTVGLRIPDVRGPNAVVYLVPTADPAQCFLLVNHQGTTSWDAKYGNRGLVIWHLLGNQIYKAWDLESADGKYVLVNGQLDRTQPDPVAGKDALEASAGWLGSGVDFFDGANAGDGHDDVRFAFDTNPNTNLYAGSPATYSSPQSRPTALSFENIRRDPSTGDMLVDIRGTPPPVPAAPPIVWNVPNPFRRTTTIRLDLATPAPVKIEVFDLQGRRVRLLEDRFYPAGQHDVAWDGRDASGTWVAAGIYLYRVKAGAFEAVKRMVLLAGPVPSLGGVR